jgi:hypothetical protein
MSFIALAEAAEKPADLRDELIAGRRKAIGLVNGNGLPVSIPCEHFSIAWGRPRFVTRPRTIDDLLVNGPLGIYAYAEPWLDVASNTIHAADGSIQWTSIKVEGGKANRVPLPKRVVEDRPGSKRPAAWYALNKLYGGAGYPTKASMQQITNEVNVELRKAGTPLKYQIKVGSDTVQRLLDRRR